MGFSPRIIRIKNKITAITKRMCINPPSMWNPKKPSSHNINKTVAIVVSIYLF